MIGSFKRNGKVYCESTPKAQDHDFANFSDNIECVWNKYLKNQYPNATMLVVLCDGGRSYTNRHHIEKQNFMNLVEHLELKTLVMHYPPYCSRCNPIEHRLFSLITMAWSRTPPLSVADAYRRTAATITKRGKVFAEIVEKTYELNRKVGDSYCKRLAKQVLFDETLHNWNYVVSSLFHVIFLSLHKK